VSFFLELGILDLPVYNFKNDELVAVIKISTDKGDFGWNY